MRRPLLIGSIVLVFVLVSVGLARVLQANSAERAATLTLVQAEAKGDADGAAQRLRACDAGCRVELARTAARTRRAGRVQVLRDDLSAGFALGSTTGIARVAWRTTTDDRPVVQCLEVHRGGDLITGFDIELRRIGPPIGAEQSCSRRRLG